MEYLKISNSDIGDTFEWKNKEDASWSPLADSSKLWWYKQTLFSDEGIFNKDIWKIILEEYPSASIRVVFEGTENEFNSVKESCDQHCHSGNIQLTKGRILTKRPDRELFSFNNSENVSEKDNEVIENKIIHFDSFVTCKGTLRFDNCEIIYNEASSDKGITLYEGAKLSFVNCDFTCKNFYDDFFISGKADDILISNCNFSKTFNFVQLEKCKHFVLRECTIVNCAYIFISLKMTDSIRIEDNQFYNSDIDCFDDLSSKMVYHSVIETGFGSDWLLFSNNRYEESELFQSKEYKVALINNPHAHVIKCSFLRLSLEIIAEAVDNCIFDCSTSRFDVQNINGSVFDSCTNKFDSYTGIINIRSCQFISWSGALINNSSIAFSISHCAFHNTSLDLDNSLILYNNPGEWNKVLSSRKSLIYDCLFDGARIDSGFLVKCRSSTTSKSVDDIFLELKQCRFKNIRTRRTDGEIINKTILYKSLLSSKTVKVAQIIDCQGLDLINKEGDISENTERWTRTDDGRQIGASL